jgi:hypothetical protein
MTQANLHPSIRRWFGIAPEPYEGAGAAAPTFFFPFAPGGVTLKDPLVPIDDGATYADMAGEHSAVAGTGNSEIDFKLPLAPDTAMFFAFGLLGAGVASGGSNAAVLLNPPSGGGSTQGQTYCGWLNDGVEIRKVTGLRFEQLSPNFAGAAKLVEITAKAKGQLSTDVTGTSFSPSFTSVPLAAAWKVSSFFADTLAEVIAGSGFSPIYLESVSVDVKRKNTQEWVLNGQQSPLSTFGGAVTVDYKAVALAVGEDKTEQVAQKADPPTPRYIALNYADTSSNQTFSIIIPNAIHKHADPDGAKDVVTWAIDGTGKTTGTSGSRVVSGGTHAFPDPGAASTTTPVAIVAGGTQPALSTYFSLGAVPFVARSAPIDANTNGTSSFTLTHNVAATIKTAISGANGGATSSLALTSGTLPVGLAIVGTTITGTPTVVAASTPLVFTVTDAATGLTCTYTLNLTIV